MDPVNRARCPRDTNAEGHPARMTSFVGTPNQGGQVVANRNVPDGAGPMLPVIGGLPPGAPAAFEACYGTSWLVELLDCRRRTAVPASGSAPGGRLPDNQPPTGHSRCAPATTRYRKPGTPPPPSRSAPQSLPRQPQRK